MRFVSHFPLGKLGILLEVGHLYQAKFDLDEAVQIFKTRLLDIHIHDAILQEDFRKATHLPIEKGTIDFPNLISNLRKVGYNGWLTLEIHGSEEEIIESKRILESMIK
jgi:sugar phosphate isomerase/epimerase